MLVREFRAQAKDFEAQIRHEIARRQKSASNPKPVRCCADTACGYASAAPALPQWLCG